MENNYFLPLSFVLSLSCLGTYIGIWIFFSRALFGRHIFKGRRNSAVSKYSHGVGVQMTGPFSLTSYRPETIRCGCANPM